MNKKLVGQKIKSFNFTKIIGEGAWAIVYLGIDDTDNT
jgi:hypothetical protein